ncbi:MAG: MinD/ParA family protein [Desulfobulbus oligotrophicus]|jgi:flagellar biosynthesis protein FlhG|nr:MinD/ParA family protein [Desulfobulbus oligotrophicus]
MAEHTHHTDQASTLRDMNHSNPTAPHPGRPATRVLSVTSGKGGVGKTAVVANLAILLARMEKRVLILDADLGLANIDVVFGLAPGYNLNHFFAGHQNLEAILVDGPEGIKILPAGSGMQRFTRLDSQQKMRLLEALESMNSDFDFVLIDTEAGISENVTYFNTAAQEILVVTTPDPTAITDAYALMKLLSTQHYEKRFSLIVNCIKSEEEALDVYRKLTMVANRYLDISIDYIGSIPRDRLMIDAIRKQQTLVQLFPDCRTSHAFKALAKTVAQEPQTIQPKGSIQFFWKRLLEFNAK